jgi:hypothetical protein
MTRAGVPPNFAAVAGSGLPAIVGALLSVVLICAVAAMVVAGVCWAFGASHDNWQLASRGKTGLLVAIGVAGAAGAGITLTNWLIALGTGL